MTRERLEDSKVLLQAGRNEGAVYLCGYALELALKKRICHTLGWQEYPDEGKGSDKYKSFKTHDLEVLLHLSGKEDAIKTLYLTEWSAASKWTPEIRYSTIRQPNPQLVVNATEELLQVL